MKKLNKKGFTLVELIAVIAILSILMILALPQVLKLFQQGRESAFVTQAQSIYKASEENFISNQISPDGGGNTVTFCHSEAGTNENPLDLSGSEEVYYKVVFSEGKMVSFQVYDASFGYSDDSEPKISEISSDTLLNQGDSAEAITITCE